MRGESRAVLMPWDALPLLGSNASGAFAACFDLLMLDSVEASRFGLLLSDDPEDWSLASVPSVETVITVAVESDEEVRDNGGCNVGKTGMLSSTPSCCSFSSWYRLSVGIPEKLKWELVPVGAGLINPGDIFLRKSKYAFGGVIGVLMFSSFLMYADVPGNGLRISEGYEADTGV